MESPVISCFLPFDSVEQVSSTVVIDNAFVIKRPE